MSKRKSFLFKTMMTITDVVSTIHHQVNNIPVTSNPKRGTFLYDLKQAQKHEMRRKRLMQEEALKEQRFQLKMAKKQAKLDLEKEKLAQKLAKQRKKNEI